jgi:putative phosphoribosyl transferase
VNICDRCRVRASPVSPVVSRFPDRRSAGQVLASLLLDYVGRPDVMVLALPRGGVPVAFEVARALQAPLDVFIVRKLGVPGHEELAMGAIASGNVRVLNRTVVESLQIPSDVIDAIAEQEHSELQRRELLFRDHRPPVQLLGKTVILVDDGLATGSTMRAAIAAVRQQYAARIVVAVPVADAETCAEIRTQVDEVVCALMPEDLGAVGRWYLDFAQTTDDEVRELLAAAGSG